MKKELLFSSDINQLLIQHQGFLKEVCQKYVSAGYFRDSDIPAIIKKVNDLIANHRVNILRDKYLNIVLTQNQSPDFVLKQLLECQFQYLVKEIAFWQVIEKPELIEQIPFHTLYRQFIGHVMKVCFKDAPEQLLNKNGLELEHLVNDVLVRFLHTKVKYIKQSYQNFEIPLVNYLFIIFKRLIIDEINRYKKGGYVNLESLEEKFLIHNIHHQPLTSIDSEQLEIVIHKIDKIINLSEFNIKEWLFYMKIYCDFRLNVDDICAHWNVSEFDANKLIEAQKDYLSTRPPLPNMVMWIYLSSWCSEVMNQTYHAESFRDKAGRLATLTLEKLITDQTTKDVQLRESFKYVLEQYFYHKKSMLRK